MKRKPIRIRCEGSGWPLSQAGGCQMCDRMVTVDPGPSGLRIAVLHERDDLLAMIERGDYDQ